MSTSTVPHDSVKALLIDTRLRDEYGDTLVSTVARLRDTGRSWREVAAKLTEWTGVSITHQTVRVWFGENKETAA